MQFEALQDLFDRTAAAHAGKPALEWQGESLTYRELAARSNRLARQLIEAGVAPGALVAILADDPFVLVPSLIGVLKAGAGFVPLDPTFPERRLARMVERTAPPVLLTQPGLRELGERLVGGASRVVSVSSRGGSGDTFDLSAGPADRPAGIAADPDSRAYVYFTSGSTGEPKGIEGRLRAIDHFIRWEIETLGLGPGARVSQLTTPSFDAFLRDVFVPLSCGGVACVPEGRRLVLDGRQLADWLDLEEIAVLHCVPSVFRSLLAEELKPSYFQALRYVLLAGEPLLPSDVARWMEVFGSRVQLVNLYGPSETTMTKFFHFVQAEDRERRSVPIGRPIRGARALLLDAQKKVSPPGSVGEIYIRTPFCALGYLDNPEATREAFVRNPFSDAPDDLVFRTGDMARTLPNGDFEFLGRRDQQVKIQGVRVELGEIESLLRRQAGVRDGVVVDREDGTGGKALFAYVVLDEGVEAGSLRRALSESLPEAMMPAAFVVMEELPRTLTGKVDRRALPDPARALAVEDADLAAPSTPTEELLASAWCDLLRLKSVGIHQSFFDLGGHSLLVTQLLSRVRSSFGLILPLDSVFEGPTIAGLARKIDQQLRAGAGAAMPPLVPSSREQDPPLSFAQERLWVLDRLEPGNPAYNVPSALELKGPLDVAALRQGLDEVVRRHESLRTSFRVRDGRPVQRVYPPGSPGPVPLPVVDLSALPEDRREEESRRQMAEEAVARFDLARDTVLRARLLRLAEERALLLVTLHHIGSDDWSASLLVEEWAAAYTAYAAGRAPALPPLPVQYADFAVWQRQWLSGEVLASLLDFWRGEMAGVAPLTDLPLDRPRPAQATYRGARQSIRLSRELSERLRALSRREGSTLFMTLMAALQALLWRHGAQDAFAVGSPVAGRHHVEVEKLIGFFINNVVVRSCFSEDLSFRESLAKTRCTVLAAFAHQDLPFEKLVEALQPERNPSFAPVFQVAFALHNARREELSEIPGLALSRVVGDVELVKADLDLDLIEIDGQVVGNLLFRMDLFDPATARRLAVHLERLLEAVTADPTARIADLPLLDPEEVRHLLSEWQGQPAPEPALFPDLIAQWAAREPERVAVEHRGEKLTFGELDRRGNQLARYLRSLGVGPETIVASAMDRGPEMITGLLGILRAGGAYLPLDPAYPSERLEMILEDAGVSVLLTQDHVASELPVFFGFPLSLDGAWGLVAAESGEPLEPVAGPDNLAYVIYTSGSTGRPKGVLVTRGGLAWVTPLYTRLAGPEQRVLQFASPGFDASIAEIVMALGSGSTLVTASQSEMAPGPDLTRLLRERRVSLVTLPPSTLAVTPVGELPELTTLIAAGETLTAEVVERWSAPGRRLLDFYGPTEGTIWASAADCGPGEAPSIGLPIPGATLHLLDPRGELAPPGVAGAVFLGGAGVTRGYLNRPDLTAERFVPDPLSDRPGDRRYRTGDLARRRGDGRLEFLGRVDQQVKIRGFRVELGEVEAVLAQHPGVESAVVLVRPGGDRLCAYWTAAQPAGPAADDLRNDLAQRLPAHAVPAEWVALPELPLNAHGKVDRRALAALGGADLTRSRSYRAPEDPLEELVAGIFSEVLGVERVGADDDFFQLGGYSLAGAQVASRIEELLGFEVPMDRLFNCPSPASLGRELRRTLLRQNAPAAAPPLVPLGPDTDRQGDLPLTFGQELMWLDHRQDPESSDAHVTWCLRLEGELDAEALGRALDEVRRRHEVLRTAILENGGSAVQRVLPFQPEPLPLEDLRDVPGENRMASLRWAVLRFRAEPFDLASGRVMRWRLYSLDEADHVLAIVCHHIVTDPWSAQVFSQELTGLYRAFSAGETSPLAELPVQVGDFALWQRRWMADEAFARRLAFWRERLAGAVPVELPLESPRTGLRAAPMASHRGELPDRLIQDLALLSRESGATLFMTLLAAFDVLLYQLTGERDLAVWSPVGKRSRPEIEPLIGFFPHGTVLRCELPEGAAFRAVLAEVRRTTLDALSHQDVPYEILSSTLLPELGLGRELMRVSANFIRTPGTLVDLPGLRVTALDLSAERRMQGDLEILFREVDGRLHYNLNYRTDRFDAATVSAWAERYEALLTAIADDPDQRLDDLRERIEKVIGLELAELPGVFA